MKKQTAIEWLIDELDYETISKFNFKLEKAKEMEKEQQIELIKFTKEMCTPDAPIDYIIKEFNKYGK
jgi:uncharacterized tellurite resistance protein B-like protein